MPPAYYKSDTLYINRNDSLCGNCGLGADPYEKSHETLLGYGIKKDSGCGQEWTKVSTQQRFEGIEQIAQDMRPDLDWVAPL